MRARWLLIAVVLSSAAVAQTLPAAPGGLPGFPMPPEPYLAAEAVASHTQVTAGQTFHVALDLRPRKGWVYYSPDPGTSGDFTPIAASVAVEAGKLSAGEVLWPPDEPHDYDLLGAKYVNNAYEGRTIVYVPIAVPAGVPAGTYMLRFHVRGQVCGEQCVNLDGPEAVTVAAGVTVADKAVENPKWTADARFAGGLGRAMPAAKLIALHKAAGGGPAAAAPVETAVELKLGIWAGLGLALLAGLILNVMPCVLPIIPIRILSIVESAKESRRSFVTLGLAFAVGILLFFVALAIISAIVRLLIPGEALDWGKHFQLAPFRIGMALLMVALAANMLGAFEVVVPGRVAALGQEGGARYGQHAASVGMGLMMAILATPCSFAILAVAFAWAQTQPLWLGSLAIVLMGVGMAAPHAVLTAFPSLVQRLPRPGAWMELLKESMGFALLLVAVWLLSTLSEQTYPAWVTAYAVVLAFCLWMWGKWVRFDAPPVRKLIVRGIAVVVAVAAGVWMLRAPTPPAVTLADFDEARIAAARKQGRPVVVKFTAAWCLSCKVVDATIYDDEQVARRFREDGVLAVKGDVTRSDMPANAMLYERFRGAPPLTVVLPPKDGKPIFLPGKFSRDELFAALDKAAGRK